MELSIKTLLDHRFREQGYALVDPITADRIGVEDGDCVRISTGDDSTVSRIELDNGETVGEDILGVNTNLIAKLQIIPDESVEVEKADSSLAESADIVDMQDRDFQGYFDSIIQKRVKGRCVTKGQEMSFSVVPTSGGMAHTVPIRIKDTDPSGVVSISDESEVRITYPPAEVGGGDIVNIDNELMKILDDFVERSGYDSKTEFVNEVIRERLRDEEALSS